MKSYRMINVNDDDFYVRVDRDLYMNVTDLDD